ncbi:MAG: double zinc ribbon domain-containing protein [Pseudomonadota bacterium]
MNIWSFFNHPLPGRCLLCGAYALAGHALCSGCFDDLPMLTSTCPRCGIALPTTGTGLPCGACQTHPPPYERTIALCAYAAPLEQLIQHFKFHNRLTIAPTLARMFAARVADLPLLPEALIPVPLHISRLRQRGYNQAVELARPLSRLLNIPVDLHSLQRTRATAPQLELDAEARRKNLRNAFQVVRPINARHVAIIDDVMTTGSTVAVIAKLLRKHGVERIDVWVMARTHIN